MKTKSLDEQIAQFLAAGGKITSLPEVKPIIFKGNAQQELIRQLQTGDKSMEDLLSIFGQEKTILNAYKALRRKNVSIFMVNGRLSLTEPPAAKPLLNFGNRIYSEYRIAKLVAEFYLTRKHLLVVNNIHWTGYECDLLAITSSFKAIEFEIKASRQDFLRDSSKEKWQRPLNIWKHYYIMPAKIFSDDLMQLRPNKKSGFLLLDDNDYIKQAVKADAINENPIAAVDLLNIARLLSQRHWRSVNINL